MGKIILSAFSDEYAVPFSEQLAAMADFGIGHIELRQADGKNVAELTAAEVKEIRAKLEYYGISVSAIGSPIGKIKITDPMEPHLDLLRKVCEIANLLNTDKVRMFSFYLPADCDPAEYKDEVMDRMEKMLQRR